MQSGELFFERGFDLFGVNVAGDGDHRTAELIVLMIELADIGGLELGHRFGRAGGRMAVWRIAKQHPGEGDVRGIAGRFLARLNRGDLLGLFALDIGVAQARILQNLCEQMQCRILIFFERGKGGD